MGLTVDLYEHFIQVPPPVPKAAHSTYPLTFDLSSKQRTKPVPPHPHGFMANIDTALEQKILYVSKRKWKAYIHHHDGK